MTGGGQAREGACERDGVLSVCWVGFGWRGGGRWENNRYCRRGNHEDGCQHRALDTDLRPSVLKGAHARSPTCPHARPRAPVHVLDRVPVRLRVARTAPACATRARARHGRHARACMRPCVCALRARHARTAGACTRASDARVHAPVVRACRARRKGSAGFPLDDGSGLRGESGDAPGPWGRAPRGRAPPGRAPPGRAACGSDSESKRRPGPVRVAKRKNSSAARRRIRAAQRSRRGAAVRDSSPGPTARAARATRLPPARVPATRAGGVRRWRRRGDEVGQINGKRGWSGSPREGRREGTDAGGRAGQGAVFKARGHG